MGDFLRSKGTFSTLRWTRFLRRRQITNNIATIAKQAEAELAAAILPI